MFVTEYHEDAVGCLCADDDAPGRSPLRRLIELDDFLGTLLSRTWENAEPDGIREEVKDSRSQLDLNRLISDEPIAVLRCPNKCLERRVRRCIMR